MKFNYQETDDVTKGLTRTLVNFSKMQEQTIDILQQIVPKLESIYDHVQQKPEYLSVGQVAFIEGVCEKTIRNRIKEGAIPAFKNEGERSYKIPALQYYETRTEVKSKCTYRNVS